MKLLAIGIKKQYIQLNWIQMNRTKVKSWIDLEVLSKAHQLVLEIYKITKDFPNDEKYRLVDQLCRASYSVPTCCRG